MKFDQQKIFPYPVLRPDIDDYIDGEFQVTVDFTVSDDASEVRVNIEFALSVPEIQSEIDSGSATFAAVISCRETFYRTVLTTAKSKSTKTFDADQIRGELVINPFVVARTDIKGFKSPDINPEFGASSFSFAAGEVLAVDEPKAIYFNRDAFRPLSSVLELARDPRQPEWTWKLSFDQNKLRILVGEKTKEEIDRARNTQKNKSILMNSIYFSAVAEATNQLKLTKDYDDMRWASVIRQQCHNKAIDLDGGDSYLIAQALLANPLGLMEQVFKGDEA
jgi:hypothetical protein